MSHDHKRKAEELGKYAPSILHYLQSCNVPQSAYDILDALRGEGVKAPMQIYRALEKLAEAGLVHKLAKSNGWIACDGHDHALAHPLLFLLSCKTCGMVDEIEDKALEDAFSHLSEKAKFSLPAQTVEIDGYCKECEEEVS